MIIELLCFQNCTLPLQKLSCKIKQALVNNESHPLRTHGQIHIIKKLGFRKFETIVRIAHKVHDQAEHVAGRAVRAGCVRSLECVRALLHICE